MMISQGTSLEYVNVAGDKEGYDGIKQDYAPSGGTIQMLFRVWRTNQGNPAEYAERC
jgi:hypothetical protein